MSVVNFKWATLPIICLSIIFSLPSEVNAATIYSKPYIDENISAVTWLGGVKRMDLSFYPYFFKGAKLGNPPTEVNTWIAPEDVDSIRVQRVSGQSCNNMANNSGLVSGDYMSVYTMSFASASGDYCDFGISGLDEGDSVAYVYILGNEQALTLKGSSANGGISTNGWNDAEIKGGFAFQLCTDYICTEDFVSPLVGLSLAMKPSDTGNPTAYFDHDDSSLSKIRFDGETNFDYENHHGTDYGTDEGNEIYAASDGTVTAAGWENPLDPNQGFGYRVRLYHSEYDLSTVYAHGTTTQTFVSVNDGVKRGEKILLSGDTGYSFGAHLHFGVFEGNNGTSAYAVDPYGWFGGGSDPRNTTDLGYLWMTNPPSLYQIYTTDITASTTWETGNVYIIDGSVTVESGVSLIIEPGVSIKFKTGSNFIVEGNLDVQGSQEYPTYFTSIKDDSVWGDTNHDGNSTSPGAGDWGEIVIESGATTSISHAIIKYGGDSTSDAMVRNNGGFLTLNNTELATSSLYGFVNQSGTGEISLSNIHNHSYGIYLSGGTLTIASSTIYANSSYGLYNQLTATTTAINNYWGSSLGPTHASNPGGDGDDVSNYVDFTSWLTSAP